MDGKLQANPYPKKLKLAIDPALFQIFVNNYRDTFRRKYKSPMERRDTFRISYEQMLEEERFEAEVLPLLWGFLGVDNSQPLKMLRETKKQADPSEKMSEGILNWDELEFCFRHTDVLPFAEFGNDTQKALQLKPTIKEGLKDEDCVKSSWSLLLPICSRTTKRKEVGPSVSQLTEKFNSNRLIDLAATSQYNPEDETDNEACWNLLHAFAKSLRETADAIQLAKTEIIVGIDVDDPVFANEGARHKVKKTLPCEVVFVDIKPEEYGRVCKIWNHLAREARNDFVVLLGDDIILLDKGWQSRIVRKFHDIKKSTGLPFGAACVALRDMSFAGFPTFPVIHRWHLNKFGSSLPKQFVNQGGDPYLFELYSRFNAAAFEVTCRLENTIGGDNDARYKKHEINWRGQILRLNIMHLQNHLQGTKPNGMCVLTSSFPATEPTTMTYFGGLHVFERQ